jgi:transcriptional regulator with GAF, ATPase, and Fis domain
MLDALDRLAGATSSALVRLQADQIRPVLDDLLSQLADLLDIDCVSVSVCSPSGNSFNVVHAEERAGISRADVDDLHALPWCAQQLLQGHPVVLPNVPDDLPPEAAESGIALDAITVKSHVAVPVAVGGRMVCALAGSSLKASSALNATIVQALRRIGESVGSALVRTQQESSLHQLRSEVDRLSGRIGSENKYLREKIDDLQGFHEIIGESAALRESLARVMEVAPTDATVLLTGDTGTGKELFARALHERSSRRHRTLVSVNCAALPPTLIESELFGHERGAFTGAMTARQGRFELADRGTLFLDEIGDLPLELQAKLLRVLQQGEFERLGSSQMRKVDVRLIAATNRNLDAMAAADKFRTDLLYRLDVFPIRVPTLRERREDIPRLVWYVIHRRQRALRRAITKVPPSVMAMFQAYEWPGNVRELENVVERAMIRSAGDTLILHDALSTRNGPGVFENSSTLDAIERRHIQEVLRTCNWRINGSGNAADKLGLHPNTLRFRMKKLAIARPSAVLRAS